MYRPIVCRELSRTDLAKCQAHLNLGGVFVYVISSRYYNYYLCTMSSRMEKVGGQSGDVRFTNVDSVDSPAVRSSTMRCYRLLLCQRRGR